MMDTDENVVIASDSFDALIDLFVSPTGSEESHDEAFIAVSKQIGPRDGLDGQVVSIQDLVGRMENQVFTSTNANCMFDCCTVFLTLSSEIPYRYACRNATF